MRPRRSRAADREDSEGGRRPKRSSRSQPMHPALRAGTAEYLACTEKTNASGHALDYTGRTIAAG